MRFHDTVSRPSGRARIPVKHCANARTHKCEMHSRWWGRRYARIIRLSPIHGCVTRRSDSHVSRNVFPPHAAQHLILSLGTSFGQFSVSRNAYYSSWCIVTIRRVISEEQLENFNETVKTLLVITATDR